MKNGTNLQFCLIISLNSRLCKNWGYKILNLCPNRVTIELCEDIFFSIEINTYFKLRVF